MTPPFPHFFKIPAQGGRVLGLKVLKFGVSLMLFVFFNVCRFELSIFLGLSVEKLGIDLMTLSSHKIYGPKGIAGLYIKKGIRLAPIIFGGSQQYGLRP